MSKSFPASLFARYKSSPPGTLNRKGKSMENQNTTGTAPETQEKTFTQEQVNAIVGKTAGRSKSKQ